MTTSSSLTTNEILSYHVAGGKEKSKPIVPMMNNKKSLNSVTETMYVT
jgi:uncharacterized surface protein with fasciclin (FAS1) repeats